MGLGSERKGWKIWEKGGLEFGWMQRIGKSWEEQSSEEGERSEATDAIKPK